MDLCLVGGPPIETLAVAGDVGERHTAEITIESRSTGLVPGEVDTLFVPCYIHAGRRGKVASPLTA
jgi:hypothetical protein